MIYSFDSELALKIGLNEAITFSLLSQWQEYAKNHCKREEQETCVISANKEQINRALCFIPTNEISSAIANLKRLGMIDYDTEWVKVNQMENITVEKSIKRKFKAPTLDEVMLFAKERDRLDLYEKFYYYYSATDWLDGNGKMIKNWKAKFFYWEDRNPKPNNTITKEVL